MSRHAAIAAAAVAVVLTAALFSCTPVEQKTGGILPSWNDGPAREQIIAFVQDVTTEGTDVYVPPAERIAVFDNDGTLWCEQPMYVQLMFTLERVKTLAPQHPEWQTVEPFRAVLEDDMDRVFAGGKHGLIAMLMATHSGMTTAEFEKTAADWIASARHPKTGKPYTEMVYQPMLELLDYLRAHDFKTFIVSGGGVEFMRPWTEAVYGIPPEQVIGSTIKTKFEMRGGEPVLVRMPEIDFIDDNVGKPVGIHKFIGRRPILAFGNSDGDLQMLQWTAANDGPSFIGIVHHTDADREWAYDRDSAIGRLDKALDEANEKGWVVVDMKNDWANVFPGDSE
jgi:hypothetical protein